MTKTAHAMPADPMHDRPYAAAFIVKTVVEAGGPVQGCGYWTFSDIFEENHFPSRSFRGGFGLMNLHGIAKPAYRAFELLHGRGTEILQMEGNHPTIDAWSVRDGHSMLRNAPVPAMATIRRIDDGHANAKALSETMGRPDYPGPAMADQFHAALAIAAERQPFLWRGHSLEFDVTVPPLGVAAIALEFASFA